MVRLVVIGLAFSGGLVTASELDPGQGARFARMALECVHREYPNKIAHSLDSDADVKPPRELTPAFYGCYDWHSSVHGHWLLARLMRLFPEAPLAGGGGRGPGAGAGPLPRQSRAGSEIPGGRGPRLVRASLRSGLAIATGRGT